MFNPLVLAVGAVIVLVGGVWLLFGSAKRQSTTMAEGGILSDEEVAAD